ncbi:hypothetical protein BC938DRAFT_480611 [Jimgerdemannia flammicorona]|uniref:Uncharacterized protein n=1 Tax=Jimgerdemannia flammicorona TaxID=994334 RepID=A0A433QI61_9FUNG|nr:hypothetical protein BC938DRAFT_480611 [Jimgerdemannia flammicorona]
MTSPGYPKRPKAQCLLLQPPLSNWGLLRWISANPIVVGHLVWTHRVRKAKLPIIDNPTVKVIGNTLSLNGDWNTDSSIETQKTFLI